MTEQEWTKTAADAFVGKKISKVEYLSKKEAEKMGWYKRPLVFIFEDNSWMFAMQDDEGNDGGAFGTSSKKIPTIPVLSLDHDKIIERARVNGY